MATKTKIKIKTKKSLPSSKRPSPATSSGPKSIVPTRPPVVVVMGHVDHGKTTLLDFIRKTNVTARESGGITQHIGAYQVRVPHEGRETLITFIDTPGHEAFSAMRARGGKVADIAVLVVAADDGVMPQTKEAIAHIKAAGIPMIVAINKVDLPAANADRVKKGLAEEGILVEGYGGDVVSVPLSAKTGVGVPELLEMILLTAEIAEISGNPNAIPAGVAIESKIDKFRGPVATLIVKDGTLRRGDQIEVGGVKGKIKQMVDGFGQAALTAGPGTPVEILGLESPPPVGAGLGEAAAVVTQDVKATAANLEELLETEAQPDRINLIIKTDVSGSLEAITFAMAALPQEVTKLDLIHGATGDVSDSDVNLARSTHALILAFRVGVSAQVLRLAETQGVQIMSYDIIYKLLDDLKDALAGMSLAAKPEPTGVGEVIATFPHDKDLILGTKVKVGSIGRDQPIKIMRGDEEVAAGRVKSIRHLKEELPKAEAGKEYGILPSLSKGASTDIQIGDQIQAFPKA